MPRYKSSTYHVKYALVTQPQPPLVQGVPRDPLPFSDSRNAGTEKRRLHTTHRCLTLADAPSEAPMRAVQ